MTFTWGQQVALAITPKITSVLSIMGSSWIVVEVLTVKQKRLNVYNRLLCAMSLFDAINSTWFFVSTWAIPEGTEDVAFAVGTELSCTVQGFFLQFGIVPAIYNACLSVYYLLVVRYGIAETKLIYVEPLFHLIPITFALSTSVAGLTLDLYNNANLWCWIAPLPADCEDSRTHGGETTCTRGDNAWIYRWAFFFAPLWGCILFVSVVMTFVYLSVRHRAMVAVRKSQSAEAKSGKGRKSYMVQSSTAFNRRSTFLQNQTLTATRAKSFIVPKQMAQHIRSINSSSQQQKHKFGETPSASIRSGDAVSISQSEVSATKHVLDTLETYTSAQHQNLEANQFGSRAVFRQSVLYMLAFYATYTFATINRLAQQITGETFFTIIYLHSMFIPLQGFFNVLVYRYAYYFRLQHRNPHMGRWELIQHTWRWSVLGPPKDKKRESQMDQTSEAFGGRISKPLPPVTIVEEQTGPSADDDPLRKNEIAEGSDAGSALEDNLNVPTLSDDVMGGGDDDDHLYDMACDLMVTYSDFPNILADDAVMVSTSFPTVMLDDYPFTPMIPEGPDAFPTTFPGEGPISGAPDAFPTEMPDIVSPQELPSPTPVDLATDF